MARFQFNKKQQITFGVLIIFIGLCIILSSYFNQKKFEVFNYMNILYFEQSINMDFPLLELEEDPEEQGDLPSEEPNQNNNMPTTTTTTRRRIDDSRHYIGFLNIPGINLRRGFVDINSRFNTVNRNIQIIYPSDMPNVPNGNMIIAAHSGTSAVSFFRDLWRLGIGDEAIINYQGQDFRYIIRDIYYVPYTGSVPIRRDVNRTTLTLITCTRGRNNMQTVYIAELVE